MRLVRLGSQTVQNVVIYTTIVTVKNDDLALLPGMTANARVFTERKPDVLRVSNAALRWQPAGAQRPLLSRVRVVELFSPREMMPRAPSRHPQPEQVVRRDRRRPFSRA